MNHTTVATVLLSLLSAGVIFGGSTNKFTLAFVPITGGANWHPVPDASNLIRYGAVPYHYRMEKHEVSRAMITTNCVARVRFTLTGHPGDFVCGVSLP